MQGVHGWLVRRRAEVTVQALPQRLRQEGTAVLAMAPAHAIHVLEPGVPTVAGLARWAEHRAG